MAEHAERFTGRVADYARYRLRYPPEVVRILRERCGLRAGWQVADVGAGTGMVAELLLAAGCEVTAVEPNAEMRAACERLLGGAAGLRVVAAAAERTGLPDSLVDMVAVGRAFHWFDRELALAEFRRILRPGGWLVLLSNRRDEDGSERGRAYEQMLRELGSGYEGMRRQMRQYDDLRPFGEAEHFSEVIRGEQSLSLAELLGQTQSYSMAPLPGEAGYAAMREALVAFFDHWSEGGRLRMETECRVAGWRVSCL